MRIAKGYTSVRQVALLVGVKPAELVKAAKDGKFALATKNGKRVAVIPQADLRKALGIPETVTEVVPKGHHSVADIAKERGITRESVYLAIRKGQLATTTVGGVLYATVDALAQWDQERKVLAEMRALRVQLASLAKVRKSLAKMTPQEVEAILH